MSLPSYVGGVTGEAGPTTTTTYLIDFGGIGLVDGDVVLVTLESEATSVVYDTSYSAEAWTLLVNAPALGSRSGAVYYRKWRTGESTQFKFRKNRANADGIAAGVYRGVDSSSIVAGTAKTRAGTPADSSVNMTALGLTTTKTDTLVLAIVMEATLNAETGAFLTGPTIPSGWTQDLYRAQNASTINTITYAHKGMASVGSSGDAVFTFQQTQASNAWAVQIAMAGIASVTPPPSGLSGVYVDAAGVAHNGYLFYNDSANVQHPLALPTIKYKPYTVTEMSKSTSNNPWLSAHRGGSDNYPEETLDGYRASAQRGMRILEISVMYSSNGTPWCFHDSNTLRTTGVSGTISSMTDTQLAALSNQGSTAALNPTQPAKPTAKLVDVIAQYKDTHVLIVEDKTYTHQTEFLNLLDSYGTAGRPANEIFVVKLDATAGQQFVTAATNRGYKTWGYIFDNDMAVKFAATLTKGLTMIGLDYHSSDATLSSAIVQLKAAGIKPTAHIVPTRAIRKRLQALGIEGVMMSNVDAAFN